MKLEEILNGIGYYEAIGSTNKEITGIQIDSRQIKSGNVFVAVKGTQTDGHAYINKAIDNLATVIVCEELPETICPDITYIKVENTENIVGKMATMFYEDPT